MRLSDQLSVWEAIGFLGTDMGKRGKRLVVGAFVVLAPFVLLVLPRFQTSQGVVLIGPNNLRCVNP